MKEVNRKEGFTFVELMIVMVILVILALTMIGNIDPIGLVNRGRDAQRKKDLGRIRVAFEEYVSDKGCYPSQALVDTLVCYSTNFMPWLPTWPCDPTRVRYQIFVEQSNCPGWFKIFANLENRRDGVIPPGWYDLPLALHLGDGSINGNDVNYGVSSANVLWNEYSLAPYCISGTGQCYSSPGPGSCQVLPRGAQYQNSYVSNNCLPECVVPCCFDGMVCN